MSDDVEIIRRVVAIFFFFAAASIAFYYLLKSVQLAFRAVRGEATFRTRERLPTKYAVFLTLAIILAMIGVVLWTPQLNSLVPYGLAIALLVGVSTWLNLRIRQHFAQRRKPEPDESD